MQNEFLSVQYEPFEHAKRKDEPRFAAQVQSENRTTQPVFALFWNEMINFGQYRLDSDLNYDRILLDLEVPIYNLSEYTTCCFKNVGNMCLI